MSDFSWELITGSLPAVEADTHVAQALARLAEFLRLKANARATISAFAAPADDVETMSEDLTSARWLENAADDQLDVIGAIVGEARNGRADDAYRIHIRARIKLNTTSGTGPEILEIFSLLKEGSETLTLREEFPATFSLIVGGQAIDVTRFGYLKGFLSLAHAAGVGAFLWTSEEAPADTFTLDGTTDQALDNGHLASMERA